METQTSLVTASNGEGRLSSVLSSENRDFLISPSGQKVILKDMEENTIMLYFGANWYPLCVSFTPMLVSVYHYLKENGSKFEVVFVSSDEDQTCFDQFYGTMPWLAIPFSDLKSKINLSRRFQIESIPSLIILNSNGEPIRTDGVDLIYRYGWNAFPFTLERIEELEGEESAKYATQTLENLLLNDDRDYVISHGDDQVCNIPSEKSCFPLDMKLIKDKELQVPISSLVGKTVGLYFSADWCLPGAKFTSRMIAIYNNLRGKDEEFEIVFVSMDRDEEGYLRCYADMPWLALPYNGEFSKALSWYFDVRRIPTLIIIGPDGKTITTEGKNLINLHFEMAFPFTDTRIGLLEEKMDEESKSYPASFNHVGHRHVLKLVSENSGGGPYLCCECEEQGLRWAYLCLECGYEVHLKCVREAGRDSAVMGQMHVLDSLCA